MTAFRPRFHIADFLKFSALCGLFLAVDRWSNADLHLRGDGPEALLYPLGMAVCCTLAFMRPKRTRTAPRCRTCGRSYFARGNAPPDARCPACRATQLPPAQRRRAEITGLIFIVSLFLMLAFVLVWPFAALLPAGLGSSAYPLIAFGLALALFVSYAAIAILRHLAGMWRMTNPAHALKVARACAGQTGRPWSFGTVTVFAFGSDDPIPLLNQQRETSRARFESLTAAPVDTERPLRIYAFGTRDAFDAFFRRAFLHGGNTDGIYVPWTPATIALTTEFPPYRLPDPARVARVLLSYFHLDTHKKCPSPLWLQVGLANVLACGGDNDELARLNRKLLASFARTTELATANLFHANPRSMIRWLRDWQDHGHYTRSSQFTAQSWSVAEYLCGATASEDRKAAFRGFLNDVRPNTLQEDVFLRHFHYGFETLLEGWREWVVAQGAGVHRPAPASIESALRDGALSVVQDRAAATIDRVQAVRELGRAGYLLGVETLIDHLGTDDPIPREELVWSLEAISGLALGHDPTRWRDWFDRLPEEMAPLQCRAASNVDSQHRPAAHPPYLIADGPISSRN